MRAAAGCQLRRQVPASARPGCLALQHTKHVHSCAPKQIPSGSAWNPSRYRSADKSVYDRNFAQVARASTATVYQRERPHESAAQKEAEFNEAEATQDVESKGAYICATIWPPSALHTNARLP